MNGNQIYCGDHCTIHSYIVSLYCMPKTNICQLYLNLRKKQKTKQKAGKTVVKNLKVQAFPFLPKKRKTRKIPQIKFLKKKKKNQPENLTGKNHT